MSVKWEVFFLSGVWMWCVGEFYRMVVIYLVNVWGLYNVVCGKYVRKVKSTIVI